MSADSVLPGDFSLDVAYLITIGRDKLIALQNEAAQRLENQARVYGRSGNRPGRQAFLEFCWKRDIELIAQALATLDKEEGTSYQPRFLKGSREDIAERLVVARHNALLYRWDEGVDEDRARGASSALRDANREADALANLGHPLTQQELRNAENRIENRRIRMRYGGVRRMDPKSLCPTCRATIYADTTYCSHCGSLVGVKPSTVVFICHASADSQWCTALVRALKQRNIGAWIDVEQLAPGDSLQDNINNAIKTCDIFLFVASKNSLTRPWPILELKAAMIRRMESGLPIIPLLIDDCVDLLPPLLRDTLFQMFHRSGKVIDLDSDEGRTALEGLLKGIAKQLGKLSRQ